MRVGINLYSKWPFAQIIDAFAECGIDRTFVCIEHPEFDEAIKALRRANIVAENFHAPFKGHNAIWQSGDEGNRIFERFIKSVDICDAHGVRLMVAHVSNGRPMPEISDIGIERFDKIMSYAKSKGITIAYECHRYLENVKFIMDRYPEAGFCLDTSHENAFTPGQRYMPMWGHRLVATHISDNEYADDKDMHMLPFDGNIDFEKTAREIAHCGRDVTLMLEVKPDNHPRYKDVAIKDYYCEAAKRIRKLAAMAEKAALEGDV
ncbi:MAG: sugar phosphate isomerase/epimerase [Clostridia bacterium]|nr:sugar phosphate isomerase/epimerase [Clostridia bacterium]